MMTAPTQRALAATALLLAVAATGGCEDDQATLVIALVPNPEINTRANVTERVNRLEVVLDAEGGFAGLDADEGDSWGPYDVVEFDGDTALELLLHRPGSDALDTFAIEQGSQGDRMITITARGVDADARLTALGGAASAFPDSADGETQVEVPFNLLPEHRPLRVLAMTPLDGSRDLYPVEGLTLQLGGEVLATAVEDQVELVAESLGGAAYRPGIALSYIDTGMGRMTVLRFVDCSLNAGDYTIRLSTEICSTTGQCLDQHLAVEGAQPFEGQLHVRGEPVEPDCAPIGVLSGGCPGIPCEDDFVCVDGVCVLEAEVESAPESVGGCDPALCPPPFFVCDALDTCVPDCRTYGACPDPTQRCDEVFGLCS